MSTTTIPPSGITLHGIAQTHDSKLQHSASAILFKLSEDQLDDVKKASGVQGGLQFVAGSAPKIRLGKKTIDLTISPEAFHHELYSASTDSFRDLDLAGFVRHRAELEVPERKQSLGTDAAVAALQSRLALHQKEKQANAVNISSNVVAEPKNRFTAAKEQKLARRRGLLGQYPASPAVGASSTPRADTSMTSVTGDDPLARMQAMRTPLVHLLAVKPRSREDIFEKTRIPKDELDEVLGKIGKQDQGKWQLTDRAYKELDVWKFAYKSQEERQAAIDNAIRAYDRLRLGKDEKLWQKLLREQDRDTGIVLSKLHLATAGHNVGGSPMVQGDGLDDSQIASTSNTPRLGPSASTPKAPVGKSSGGALSKRLFAKDPKKRAAEESKEKKRKEKEAAAAAAASDREGNKQPPRKKQTTKTNNPKVKSAEIVHSSSEASEGEIRESGSQQKVTAPSERKPATNAAKPRPTHKPVDSVSPNPTNGTIVKSTARNKPTAEASTPKLGTNAVPASKTSSASASKPTKLSMLERNTPNGLSAPSSQSRNALSPQQRPNSRPKVPSPLGAARPRVASDVSERGAVGVQRVRQGAETPKGLGITNGVRKRHDTVTSTGSQNSNRSDKMNGDTTKATMDKPKKPTANGNPTSRASLTYGNNHKDGQGIKRKAVDSPRLEAGSKNKHRKTESTSSHSGKSSFGANSSIDNGLQRSLSSDSSSSIINDITFSQGVSIARKFRDDYYPAYAKLYDEQAEMEKRGETVSKEERDKLWSMHRRLDQMKREIKAASQREHLDE